MKTGFLAVLATVAMVSPIAATPAAAQRDRYDNARNDYRWQGDRDGNWNPSDSYREGRYRERRLGRNDRIYRGQDGRAYCRRNDGTTGLVVGAVGGGVLGNLVGGGTLGTLLGAGGGALLGRSVDRGKVRCR
ncbi:MULTISPECIES: glycine zipper 2TM domain-containing protein [Sphingomonas]|uniref:17 kDa surface antigen n=1 Tax=Sphingomonas kyungheensis TaxID=1069987 RepID=A0ABU8H097_9SPHN|nr:MULTISPECIES: glycine zipper 2TM domain-containing protein [unclassified Sphingomonas]EZP51514.1 17 kDa surface antigen [Sphingomonas sp. RIT328]